MKFMAIVFHLIETDVGRFERCLLLKFTPFFLL